MRRAYPGPVVTDDYFPSLAVHCVKAQLPLNHPQLSFSKPEGRCTATGRRGGREGCSSGVRPEPLTTNYGKILHTPQQTPIKQNLKGQRTIPHYIRTLKITI